MRIEVISAFLAIALALIHIFANKLTFLTAIPRSKWLSFAGGIAVSYVFVHILPELQEWQLTLEEKEKTPESLKNYLYLIALAGLVIFYGLERAVIRNKRNKNKDEKETTEEGVFWIHIASFAIYNALVGYLLLKKEDEMDLMSSFFLFLALAFHFLVNDFGLYSHHKNQYLTKGRWVVAVAVIGGWLTAYLTKVPEMVVANMFAFLAGGIVLNTLKEELPEERESNFWAFLIGAAIYSTLLML